MSCVNLTSKYIHNLKFCSEIFFSGFCFYLPLFLIVLVSLKKALSFFKLNVILCHKNIIQIQNAGNKTF